MTRGIYGVAGTALAAALLTSCGGDNSDGPVTESFAGGSCTSLGRSVAVEAPNVCSAGCSDNSVPRAADDNFGTYASSTFDGVSTGTTSITARGLNSEGGHFAGAVINLLESGDTSSNLTVRVSTLDITGTTLESGTLVGTGTGNAFGDSDLHVVGFTTTLPFDGIAVEFARSVGTESKTVQITEICLN